MDNIKNDEYYLKKIKYILERIEVSINGVSYDEYLEDEQLRESKQ